MWVEESLVVATVVWANNEAMSRRNRKSQAVRSSENVEPVRWRLWLSLVLFGLLGLWAWRRGNLRELGNTPPKNSEPSFSNTVPSVPLPAVRAGRHLNTASGVGFVGAQVCSECHQEQHRSFLDTPHSRALSALTNGSLPANSEFQHARSQLKYAVVHANEQEMHRVSLSDAEGALLAQCEFPMTTQIGSGNHSTSYLFQDGNFLFESPMTWYRSRNAWGLSPGYDNPLPMGFERMVDVGCLVCHAGRVESVNDNRFRPRIIEQTIGCESCHGPGELHVQRWRGHPAPATVAKEDLTIVNPARLTRMEAEQICASCHLRGDATVTLRGRRLTDFRPGLQLADFRTDFYMSQDDNAMTVTGHFEQMRRSKCYISSGKLTCITCHDPHARPDDGIREAYFRQKCVDCHAENCRLDRATRMAQQPADDCVACHMPRGDTDIPHIAFTHHRIGIHSPKESLKADASRLPVTVRQLVASESLDHLSVADQLRCTGLAFAEVSEKQATPEAREFCRDVARRKLREAYEQGIRDAALLATLSGLEMELGRRDVAVRLATESLEHPNANSGAHENARFVLANAYLEQRQFEQAEETLLAVVEQRHRTADWLLLATIRLERNDRDGQIAALRTAERLNPFRPDLQRWLADALIAAGESSAAERHRRLEQNLLNRLRK